MNTVYNLIKRNILVYLRDRTAVFFSLLSMFIVIALMGVFLGNMNSDEVVELLKQYGGARDSEADRSNAVYLIQMWTVAGILMVNSVTVTLTMIGLMVQDEAHNRLACFYAAPVRRIQIALGYIASAVIVGTGICIVTLIFSEVYIVATGGTLLGLIQTVKILGLIVINVLAYACIMFLIAMFVHSDSAWSGLGTIIGTLVGFLGAIYLPMGMLPEAVQNGLKVLPILQGASVIRKIATEEALNTAFRGVPDAVIEEYQKYMGITVELDGKLLDSFLQVGCVIGAGLAALLLASFILRKRAIRDR